MLSIKNKKIILDLRSIRSILDGFSTQIKTVDFFKSDRKITQIFSFLKKIVRLKPTDPATLKSFNNVCLAIHYKILSQSIISQKQMDRIEDYLQLLKTILQPQHRYLFDSNEITLQAKSLQEISSFLMKKEMPIPLSLLDILIHDVLKPSFHHLRFLNDYPRLVQTIYFLAQGVEKNCTATDLTSFGIEGNISVATVASSRLFNTLGTLLYQLRYQAKKPGVLYHLPATVVDFEQAKNRLCRLFKLSVNKDLLGSIVYNLFLYPAYKDEPDYLHAHPGYVAQCKSARRRFSKRYRCKRTAKMPSLAIRIEYNNLSKMILIKACHAMRQAEGFIDWLQGLELRPVNSNGAYLLRIAESRPDFFLDMSYFERDRSVLQDIYATAYYYPQEMRWQYRRGIQGVTYTYLTYPFVIAHEYLHHLYFFLMGKNMYIDQTSTEGIAELFAGGICHPSYVKQLRFFANDSTMLRTLHRIDILPDTFYAFKWVGYLVNQQIIFFTRLLMLLKQGKKDRFYSEVSRFLDNSTHIQDFLSWSILQAGVCEAYFERYPDFPKRPIIYLRHIGQRLAADLGYKPVAVRKSRSALAVAEKVPILIWTIPTFTFAQVTTNRSLSFSRNDQPITPMQLHLNQTELAVYKPRISPLIEIAISLPLSALFCGVLSAGLDHIGEINKQAYFYLPRFITYGLKPTLFAFISAGVNSLIAGPIQTFESKVLSFFVYFAINYSGLLAAQAINQKVSEKIRNKWLVFFIQIFTWMCLWNPGLLTSEAFFSEALSSISLSLMQGFFFVLGERGAHAMMTHMPSRDHAKETLSRSSKQVRFHADVVRGIMGTQETDKEASLEMDLLSSPCRSCPRAQMVRSDITFWSRSNTAELSYEDSEDLSIKSCSSGDVRRLSSSV